MTITQTVDIPDSHKLTIDVPREVPAGPVILTFTPARNVEIKPFLRRTARTVEEALQMAKERASDSNRKPISHYFGILSPETFGDSVAYQRAVRDEWD